MKLRVLSLLLSLAVLPVPVFADDPVPESEEVVALRHLEEVQKWHLKTLTELLDKVPDSAKPAFQHAIEASRKGLEHSQAAVARARGGDKPGKGKPEGVGKPDHAGKPDGVGQGKPQGVGHGKPEGVGKGVGGGKPAGAGKGGPAGLGKPNKG